ncbi:putative Mitogen-activated protein kinase kinase kinase 5 [Blattamonas nauphoetae]|uniref:non-specific serine/threonine protein kinase n=1 Tax=Blattamonas nauphoetae TaxID=2049346 RepID=A0ABQ9WZC0_9EUKA|nr:putative Mitogen-activated protein kinase kinase kinase 5 [Blattamonas nauphoetae]
MSSARPKPKSKATPQFKVKVPEPYKFVRTLGQGRFGSVHEVSKTPSNEHFAMKILPFTSESDFKKNEHEIAKLSKYQHRNVVGFVEAIKGDTAHFVVLELCLHSLQSEMSENQKLGGKMDIVRVYRVMRDVLDGIAFLHSRGQIYGDLKGPNVLIGKDGVAKLGDFGGVAGTGTLKTYDPAECGTMQFWAPEFFKLTGKTDSQIGSAAGDMWAFGQLLLEMLTSRSWIVGGSSVEIEKSVLGFDINQICQKEEFLGETQILLSLLLSKNPSERISSAELVRTNRLQKVLGPETPLSRFFAEELDTTRIELETTREMDRLKIESLEGELSAVKNELRRTKDTTSSESSPFVFTDQTHFRVFNNEVTRTSVEQGEGGVSLHSSLFLNKLLVNRVISVEVVILSLNGDDCGICVGLMDSSNAVPKIGESLGSQVPSSVSLSEKGRLLFNTPSSHSSRSAHPPLKNGDRVRIEVDLESTPRKVLFLVNGETGRSFVSGIPSSVRIGFSVLGIGTSLRIDNISRLSRPTPTTKLMKEVKWDP